MQKILITLIALIMPLIGHAQQYNWTDDHPLLTSFVSDHKQSMLSHLIDSYKKSEKYRQEIEQIFITHDIPPELYALASIESNFSSNASSHAGAVGMWQFMKGTAKDMNLKVNQDIDERRNWQKSTKAAAQYLKYMAEDLFYGDYELAILAYNAGPGRVLKAIKKNDTNNPWELIKDTDIFPRESRHYLPRVVAAIHIFQYIERKEHKLMADNQ